MGQRLIREVGGGPVSVETRDVSMRPRLVVSKITEKRWRKDGD